MPAVTLYTVVNVCSFARYLRRARRHVCAFLLLFLRLSLFLLRPDRAARSIAMSVSVSVLVCPDHIFGTTRPSLNLLCMLPTTVVWVLLWRSTDTLCTSDHMDDVIFAHRPRLLDVGPSRSAAHTQPWAWL